MRGSCLLHPPPPPSKNSDKQYEWGQGQAGLTRSSLLTPRIIIIIAIISSPDGHLQRVHDTTAAAVYGGGGERGRAEMQLQRAFALPCPQKGPRASSTGPVLNRAVGASQTCDVLPPLKFCVPSI